MYVYIGIMFLILIASLSLLFLSYMNDVESEIQQHYISISKTPTYGNHSIITKATVDAIKAWNEINPNVHFYIVNNYNDSNVHIHWAEKQKGSLGKYYQVNGIVTIKAIEVELGYPDCLGNYVHYNYESLRYVVTHEIGHYLGLAHIDKKGHLMHSTTNPVDAYIYDDLGLSIPDISRPIDTNDVKPNLQIKIRELAEIRNSLEIGSDEYKTATDNFHDSAVELMCTNRPPE